MERYTHYENGEAVLKLPCLDFEMEYTCPEAAQFAAYEDTGLMPEEAAELARAKADGRLVVLNTAPQEEHDGLKRKYIVFKSDTGEPVEGSFVLRPDVDYAAAKALEEYARTTTNKELAADIVRWLANIGKTKTPPCTVGDVVYRNCHGTGEPVAMTTLYCEWMEGGFHFVAKEVLDENKITMFNEKDIGKTFFLSEAEAKQ